MNVYIALALCFLPLILCFVLFKVFSKIKFSTELIASLSALLCVLPLSFIQFLIVYYSRNFNVSENQILPLFFKCLCFNGLVEEGVKLLFLLFVPRKNTKFSHYFIAAILFGLAFGCFESVIYFLTHLQSAKANGAELIYHLIFLRMGSAVLVHTFCSGLIGIFIWSCREKHSDFLSLLFPVIMHGLYDFFVNFTSWIQWFSIAAVLIIILECRIRYEKNKPAEDYKKNPVPAKDNEDVTIETALKDTPAYND